MVSDKCIILIYQQQMRYCIGICQPHVFRHNNNHLRSMKTVYLALSICTIDKVELTRRAKQSYVQHKLSLRYLRFTASMNPSG